MFMPRQRAFLFNGRLGHNAEQTHTIKRLIQWDLKTQEYADSKYVPVIAARGQRVRPIARLLYIMGCW